MLSTSSLKAYARYKTIKCAFQEGGGEVRKTIITSPPGPIHYEKNSDLAAFGGRGGQATEIRVECSS